MKKIKVLHFFGRMDIGGAETFTMNLYRNIDKSRFQFDFVVSQKGFYDNEIKKLGGNIYILPVPNKRFLSYKKSLKRLLLKEYYDVVHSHVHYYSGINLKIANTCGVPVRISHSHSTSDGKRHSIFRKIYRCYMINLIKANGTMFLGCGKEANFKFYGNNFLNKAKVIHNGIDIVKFKEVKISKTDIKNKLGIDNDGFVIGHVGRFCEMKNHTFIIDIFKNLLEVNNNSHLILVGDGPLKAKIEDKVNKLNINKNVLFLGERTDIPELLKGMDVFLFPSIFEGLPLSLIEAQASGLRCIISDAIDKKSCLSDKTVIVNLDSSIDEWCRVIIDENIKGKAYDYIDNYDIQKVVQIIEQIYMGELDE